jgi:hypothetical protein
MSDLLPTQLQRTVRALELLGKSYEALTTDRDKDRCDAFIDQALAEAGADTFTLIRGGMRIGEIPMPSDPLYWLYVNEQRGRLAEASDNPEGA